MLLAQESPGLLGVIKGHTKLSADMGAGSSESRNQLIKSAIADALSALRASRGSDIIARELGSNAPITVDAACTYLSAGLSGVQGAGGGGDTVVKRTLKLLAHQ